MVVGVDKDTAQTQQPAHRRTVSRWEDHAPQTDLAHRFLHAPCGLLGRRPPDVKDDRERAGRHRRIEPDKALRLAYGLPNHLRCTFRRVALFEHEIEADKVDSHRLDRLP